MTAQGQQLNDLVEQGYRIESVEPETTTTGAYANGAAVVVSHRSGVDLIVHSNGDVERFTRDAKGYRVPQTFELASQV